MVNGKNVSMFASYPHSAAWELAHTFAALLFLTPFFRPEDGTAEQAACAQTKALVKVLRMVGKIEEARRLQAPRAKPRVEQTTIDWMKEADRVECFARERKWSELIDWAQETRTQVAQFTKKGL